MGSSKTAQVLMTNFNYQQKNYNVLLVKPSIDTRNEKISSRIGLEEKCINIAPTESFEELFNQSKYDVIIVDEAQFLTEKQVEELRDLTQFVPVLCFGLLTNFKSRLFEGSKRLIELADSLTEIKSICKCGHKANFNARIINGEVVYDGPEILIGADEKYEGRCWWCYSKSKNN